MIPNKNVSLSIESRQKDVQIKVTDGKKPPQDIEPVEEEQSQEGDIE